MDLLKELYNTSSEKATRARIVDMILQNAKQVDKSHLKDKSFSALVLKAVRKADKEGITKGLSDEALLNLIKLNAEPTLEDVVAEAEGDEVEDNEPQEIGKAGTYRVMFFPADEKVQVVDANKKVLLEMPFVLWKQLIRQ